MNGFFLINKPEDFTSRDVCNKLQHLFHTRKVGHIGTLDPFATGLLIIAFGEATKCIPLFDDFNKEYVAEIKLGEKTDSGDLTGQVIDRKPFDNITKEAIEKCLKNFIGKQKQIPPMTSAIHINGVRLYDLAHKGQEIERPARDIEIHSLNLISFDYDKIIFKSLVSKGTYIRTLGSDIAESLETVGHLINLQRTKIGPFDVRDSYSLEDVLEENMISIPDFMSKFIPILTIDENQIKRVKNGMQMKFNSSHDKILLVDINKKPLAIYAKQGDIYSCFRGFNIDENN